ncbi:hypothetical protein SAMN04488527_12161 [Aliiroseovarius crassostreae]|uniref:Transposase n=1 Tax=Aliiroseovarius crassostreae TaxID=154981 RepID=A0A0P7IYJ3_9RHOB|nr:hypothetical protein [Aliiroseovarius crassostreae]KPN64888.1 hypothetical protein AKJ29_06590 [Aliiroseovarius crassostreae]SFU84193.1 hypothetical protein SAMN04488527_12161 [Aliiroseovarius crassostreae]
MTKTNMDLSELLAKQDGGDFLRSVAKAVLQLIIEAEVRRLKKEVARVTEERDVLTKGETIFRHWSEDNGRTRPSPGMHPSRDIAAQYPAGR